MLISSIGLMEKPELFDISRMEVHPLKDAQGRDVPNKGPAQIHLRYAWSTMFSKKISPFSIARKAGKTLTKSILNLYVA